MISFGVVGATGSVGSSILALAETCPRACRPVFLAANRPSSSLRLLGDRWNCPVHSALGGTDWDGLTGERALEDLCLSSQAEHLFFAASGIGTASLLKKCLEVGKIVSLANKESALLLGKDLASYVRAGQLRPLDSEHNALWQCLRGERNETVSHLWLTASGGPFLHRPLNTFDQITPQEALRHPVWSMGAKITVDSATMANKGIEVLEAACLFGQPLEEIDGVICPGSALHGAVSFVDGTMKLLASPPSMTLSAAACLFENDRPRSLTNGDGLDLRTLRLEFQAVEKDRFPAYELARSAGRMGQGAVLAFLAADEAAVELFLAGRIKFTALAPLIERAMERFGQRRVCSLDEGRALMDEVKRKTLEEGGALC